LSPEAVALDHSFATNAPIPEKLAIVMGRETDGCTAEILAAADKRVYIPLYGFTESLNMSVAAAMLIQWVMLRCPESRGDIPTEEKQQIREKWLSTLAKSDSKRETYAKYANIDIEMLDDLRRSEKEAFITNKVKRKLDDQRAKATTKSAGVNAALAANDAMDTDSASTEAVGDLPESDAKRAKTNE
jgi:tRNA C32,U32 (ribose-2'-O)-methylase TrmJ